MEDGEYKRLYTQVFSPFDAPEVEEVLVNSMRGLWLLGGGQAAAAVNPFRAAAELVAWTQELARRHGVRLDPVCGSAGGSLADHSFRWHCVLPPLSPEGPLLSLRRHRFDALSVASFAAEAVVLDALRRAAAARAHIILVGPTGSGKTTLLASLLREYAAGERVVLVESLAELPLPSPFSVRLLERRPNLEGIGAVSMTRLVQEALRLRPDRLVIGEIRGQEAAAFCEALISGHEGCMTTLHAVNADDAVARLALLARGAGWGRGGGAWQGVPLVFGVLARGRPPRLQTVACRRFVPSG